MTHTDDVDLVTSCRQGNLEAFSQVVLRYQTGVRAYLAVRMNNPHDAEDLAQEVFVLAFRKLPEFDPARPLAPWLRGIAFNLLRNHLRKSHVQRTTPVEDIEALVNQEVGASFEAGGEAEQYAAMRECLQRLDGTSRRLVEARYEEGVEVAELCSRLGRKHSAVTMHLHRIRQQLRNCMELRLKTT